MKRANIVLDLALWFLILTGLGMVLLVGHTIQSNVNTAVQADLGFDSEAKASLQGSTTRYAQNGDNIFVFALFLTWLFVFVASFLLDSHPLFYGISLLLLVFIFLVGAIMSNFFSAMAADPTMAIYAADYPKMAWCMDHLLEIGIAVAFTTMIGVFGKSRVS